MIDVAARKPSIRLAAALLLLLTLSPARAHAVSKDMVQLQTQIQQLQDAVARLQQSNDERMGVLKDLVQQSADSVNRMSLNMDALQKQMRAQQETSSGKMEQISTQVQSLNDSLDEMKSRLGRLDKTLQDIQSQQQSLGAAAAQSGASPAGGGISSLPPAGSTAGQPLGSPAPLAAVPPTAKARGGKPSAGVPLAAPAAVPQSTAAQAPPADELYKTALGDYMAANYPLASAEFSDVVRAYPDNPLAGNAFYYMGEIDYRKGRFAAAAQDYDHLLEQFPGNSKIPAAHLHKAQALFVQKQDDAGIRELRALIARFPTSPEATQARSKLNGMGVPIIPRK